MENTRLLEDVCQDNQIRLERDVPLKDHCTFKIGGPARYFVCPDNEEQLALVLPVLEEAGIPGMILGRGSNVLFADRGFDGAVICLSGRLDGMVLEADGTVCCGAGASLMQLCRFALDKGLSGLEFAFGIPGTVGGAIYMNAGAYGGEMKDVLLSTRHLDPWGERGGFAGEEMGLAYRHSAYSDGSLVITGGVFRLKPGDKGEISAKMEDFLGRRKSKQPLEFPSAGSTFRRPVGGYASALIDQCGLKGLQVGGAQVSEKHAGFVINRGGATCQDVLALVERIQQEVLRQTGFRLECEMKMIG